MSLLDDLAANVPLARMTWPGDPPPAPPPHPSAVWGWDHFGERCWVETDAALRERVRKHYGVKEEG